MRQKGSITILHSGGIDSTALIHFYKKMDFNITSFFIDYGQLARKTELAAVKKVCRYYEISSKNIQVLGAAKFGPGDILGRNLFLISTALMFSKMQNGIIGIGIHAGTDYIDCNEPFVNACSEIIQLYSSGTIVLGTPFLKLSKFDILQYCRAEGVPLGLTVSCEKGKIPACGTCGTCKELKKLYARKDK